MCLKKLGVRLPLHPRSGIPSHPPPPGHAPSQSHLWLSFLMTNLNALIRKHLRVHSSQTPYGAQHEICFIFMKAKPEERAVFWIAIVVPTLGEEIICCASKGETVFGRREGFFSTWQNLEEKISHVRTQQKSTFKAQKLKTLYTHIPRIC